MQNLIRRAGTLFAILAIITSTGAPAVEAAGVPKIINYQGRLMDAGGTLLGGAGTQYCFRFSFYDTEAVGNGNKLWPSGSPSTMTVTVRSGVFSAGIGDPNAGGDTLDFNFQDSDAAYLNVDVAEKVGATCAPGDGAESFETLSPRQRIYSSGYAINSDKVDGFDAAQHASGNEIPVLDNDNLILGGSDPTISATTTNALVIQGSSSGDVRFFNTSNRLTSDGNLILNGQVIATSSLITNATTTFLSIGSLASTSNLRISNGFTFGSGSGILKAVAGAVTTALVDLSSDVQGVLDIANGGTGTSAAPTYGQLLVGNAAGGYDLIATSSLGIGGIASIVNNDSTLTVSMNGDEAVVGLNLANQNAWTGLQVFNGASSTVFSSLNYVAIGRTATTTIRGEANATSTFAGGIEARALNVTAANATSTFANGIDLSGGCFSIRGECIGTGTGGDAGFGVEAVQVYTSTGASTWTKPSYVNNVFVEVWGAGGAGVTGSNNSSGGGGGGGGYSAGIVAVDGNETVTVGAGGGTSGAAGDPSSFTKASGGTVTANGGSGASTITGGAGALTGSGATVHLPGSDGGISVAADGSAGAPGGSSPRGGAGGSGGMGAQSGNNGTSVNARAGAIPGGGGGGGSEPGGTFGAGANGMVVVWELSGTNGSDLAEMYETMPDVEPGDVVAISPSSINYDSEWGLQKIAILKKAVHGEKAVGVVATAPAIVMGRTISDEADNPRPIALAGRTPVKVSPNSAPIKAGDLIIPSADAGLAMRTDMAGEILGWALEDYTPPTDGSIGEVMIFVHTGYSSGARTKAILENAGIDTNDIPAEADMGRLLLAQAISNKKNFTASSTLSEVVTDRLFAGLEVISPRVLADTLVVNAIEPVEKDVRLKIADDGAFVIERVSEDAMTLTFANGASAAGSSLAVSIDAIGNALFAGTLTAANFVIGTSQTPGGLTMYDSETGEPYCTRISGGKLITVAGTCGTVAGASVAAESENSGAPVITVNGANPARIPVGATYADLGAMVRDDKDENLALHTFFDGKEVAVISLDTSAPREYTITYRAKDSDGHTAEATRTVIVEDESNVKIGEPETPAPEAESSEMPMQEAVVSKDSAGEESSSDSVSSTEPAPAYEADSAPEPKAPENVAKEAENLQGGSSPTEETVVPEPEIPTEADIPVEAAE